MSLTKRELLAGVAAATAALSGLTRPAGAQELQPQPQADHDMSAFPAHWYGKEQIAFLVYPGFTALDLVGPHYMLTSLMGATAHIVASTRDPVTSDQKLTLTPSATFEDCPKDLDIICVPGGTQ